MIAYKTWQNDIYFFTAIIITPQQKHFIINLHDRLLHTHTTEPRWSQFSRFPQVCQWFGPKGFQCNLWDTALLKKYLHINVGHPGTPINSIPACIASLSWIQASQIPNMTSMKQYHTRADWQQCRVYTACHSVRTAVLVVTCWPPGLPPVPSTF